MTHHYQTNPRQLTILAGICFLILVVAGPIGLVYVPSQIVEAGNAAATAQNLQGSPGLFQIGIMAQFIIVMTEVVLTALLYVLLKPSSQPLALMAAFARLAMTVVMATNIAALLEMQQLAGNLSYLASFTQEQRASMIMLAYDKHMFGTIIWQLIFALHLLVLGMAVVRSTYIPQFIGWALVIGSPSYALESLGRILALSELPVYSMATNIFLGIAAIGELGLGLWLLFKGVNQQNWQTKITG